MDFFFVYKDNEKCNDKWPLSTRERESIKGSEEQFDTHTNREII